MNPKDSPNLDAISMSRSSTKQSVSQQGTLLSPHNSVMKALRNPELDAYPDDQLQFSVTSWQAVSPRIGSILSSSETEEDPPLAAYPRTNPGTFIVGQDCFDRIDSELSDLEESLDDDSTRTPCSSSVVPSFVMPRVSIPTLSSIESSKIVIQVVGKDSGRLVSRLSSYRKTLSNIVLQTGNDPAPQLMILLVNRDNYLLPRLTKTAYVPIVVEDRLDLRRLPRDLMVCKPLRLKSLQDDLTVLIDFLSELDSNCQRIHDLLESGQIGSGLKLSGVNSVMITRAEVERKERSHTSTSSSPPASPPSSYQSLRAKLFLGFTFGVVSMTFLVIWKELTREVLDEGGERLRTSFISFSSRPELPLKPVSARLSVPIPVLTDCGDPFSGLEDVNSFVVMKLDVIFEEIAELSRLLFSQGVVLYERVKNVVLSVMN